MKTKILYEDKQILICYKPAGLATQTARVGQQDMVSELKNYLKQPYLGVVHRLDQPVEGLLVFAGEKQAAARLTAQLADGTLNKQYYAVVCGQPVQKEAELVDYMAKDPATGSACIVQQSRAAGEAGPLPSVGEAQKAILQYRVLETATLSTGQAVSLLDIHIDTGRFHQIRAQMAHAGYPLLGDSRYGTEHSQALSRQLQVRNVALCAYQIDLKHPATGRKMSLTVAPQGKVFRELFRFAYPASS